MTVRSSAKSRTLVLFASEKGSAAALEVVLDACREAARGPQEFRDHINVPDRKGNGPLALAARAGKPANVGLLLMRGADPLHRNRVGDSAVHLAAQSGCAQSLGLLLSARGAGGVGTVAATIVHSRHSVERYVDAPNDSGLAPLHVACLHGHLAAVNALILHGAALDAPVLGVSRRVVAAAAAHHRRRGATAGAAGLTAGATPLHIAAAAGDAAACIALLDAARAAAAGAGPRRSCAARATPRA
ncbi:hypothetical protein QBZ16_001435 [Prototheca wickerhamii]|uniref:Uncharacterized protein n=1 Tax=Prototheca wickerhamii TaxID=3111 RepID=A0AAD9IDJ5_PROWI|nr:hypothetical protein QBZ16_001435 [Prototheca wickerhamii]